MTMTVFSDGTRSRTRRTFPRCLRCVMIATAALSSIRECRASSPNAEKSGSTIAPVFRMPMKPM